MQEKPLWAQNSFVSMSFVHDCRVLSNHCCHIIWTFDRDCRLSVKVSREKRLHVSFATIKTFTSYYDI